MSAAPKRGIKRKRDPDEPSNEPSKVFQKPSLSPDVKFRRKLYHGIKEIKKAAKIAKTRELQRLVKRLKEFRAKEDQEEAISAVEEQLELLKTLDHEIIATHMLLRRLQKDKHIQSNELAKSAISEELEMPSAPKTGANGTNLRILESRLSSSKALAGPVGVLIAALRSLILPRKVDDPGLQVGANAVFVGTEEENEGWESGSIKDNNQMDEDMDDGTENDKDPVSTSPLARGKVSYPQAETDNEEDVVVGYDVPSVPTGGISNHNKLMIGATMETGDSAFLPTLAVGYTRGDSSVSDWSGDDGDEKIDPNPRKNCRGQRARKAIWEKKYGRNANHLKKLRETDADERKKRAEKAKSSAGSRYAKGGGRAHLTKVDLENRHTDSGWSKKRDDGTNAGSTKEASLHPSWDAARRRKAAPMVVPSAGKKIVF